MGAVRFEGVDILDSLGQIMELHTQHYKDDFDLDKELIPKLALSGEPEDRRLLWLSRPCGTYTLREWEVYLEGSHANKVWEFYHEQTKDPVLAYALSIKDVQDGKVVGNIYPLDYGSHVERVKLLDPKLRTGQILSAAYGDFYFEEKADFISIRASFVNRQMVERAHARGMTVHAWTVNSKSEMERLRLMEVDNLITDYPVLAREIIYREEATETLLEYLQMVFR